MTSQPCSGGGGFSRDTSRSDSQTLGLKCVKMETQRDRQRQTDRRRETDRQRETERERGRERQAQGDGQIDRDTYRERERQAGGIIRQQSGRDHNMSIINYSKKSILMGACGGGLAAPST